MKIIVNLTDLTSEPVKCLSQLGMFRDGHTWEGHCDREEFLEAVALLGLAVSRKGGTRARRDGFATLCP